jgi:hypothetical protein
MSIETTLARVEALRQALADPAVLVGGASIPAAGAAAGVETSPAAGQGTFAAALRAAGGTSAYAAAAPGAGGIASYGSAPTLATYGASPLGAVPANGNGSPGARIVAVAESQIGQAEQPAGSNESPAIAMYRSATTGAIAGAPWCAYFASWVAREAGVPIGEGGQGLGAVSEIWSWAQSTGRAIANGPGVVPRPGDLIVFGDEHVGIVRSILPDGRIQTIEGNYENKVAENVRSAGEASGYVNMG